MEAKPLSRRSFLRALAVAPVAVAARPLSGFAPSQGAATAGAHGVLNAGPGGSLAFLPRVKTLYVDVGQWGPIVGWNPYSSGMNNTLAIQPGSSARLTVFETPYAYNLLDGKQYPLLADGPYAWNDARTEVVFKLKAAARWRDGSPVTAEDVAYTWATHLKYGTDVAWAYQDYIGAVAAVDKRTVSVSARLDKQGRAVNPLMLAAYLSSNYVIQKAWTQKLEKRTGDPDAFKADPALDVIGSGPYFGFLDNDEIVVLVRNDEYWGADASMWGRLPAPKYLAHVAYADSALSLAALKAGALDVTNQYIPNVQQLWLQDKLPVSTYLPSAPYHVGATLPTAFYNLGSYGLDRTVIRKAIAIAVDYPKIIADAMSNQSATFAQVPRSLMNPTPGEQALYDHAAVADLQWVGGDIDNAKQLLDGAGITDTNGDGWRELDGKTLHYTVTCPNGWGDWQGAVEVIVAACRAIGINAESQYPEWTEYQGMVTNWPLPEAGFDIFVMWTDGAGPTQPWERIRHLIGSEYAQTSNNWSGNWGGYINPAGDALIRALPTQTDPAAQRSTYTELTRIYLTDIPSFTLMYRPQSFHTVSEAVWTNFPHQGDGSVPPIPPLNLVDGWSIAGLYGLKPRLSRQTYLPSLYR